MSLGTLDRDFFAIAFAPFFGNGNFPTASQKLGEKVYADMQAQQAAAGASAGAADAGGAAKPADNNVVDAEVKEVKKKG